MKRKTTPPQSTPDVQPPRLADALLELRYNTHEVEEIQGDLLEVFGRRAAAHGPRAARRGYWLDVLRFVQPFGGRRKLPARCTAPFPATPNPFDMFRNYLTISLRTLRRDRTASLVSVLGLSVGLAAGLLIFLLVSYMFSFDRYHPHQDRTYWVVTDIRHGEVLLTDAAPRPLAEVLRRDYPFVQTAVRLETIFGRVVTIPDGKGGIANKFPENRNLCFTEPQYFEVFGVDWRRGDRKTALAAPNSIVLSQRYAEKYFGDADPMGKTVRFDHQVDLTVTGVVGNPPSNTQLRFDGFVSFATLPRLEGGVAGTQSWDRLTSMCFVVLRPDVPAERLRGVFPALQRQHYGPGGSPFAFGALPLRELNHQRSGNAPRSILYTLIAVGVFLVAAACINFVNVATARALRRAREIGVRKAIGSTRRQLVAQFLLETTLITGVAVVLALGLTQACLPPLNNALSMLGADLSVLHLLRPGPLGWFTGLVLGVIGLAGLYPAVVQAGFRPVEALKGQVAPGQAGGDAVRRGLVGVQFFITQFFLIGVIVLVAQLRYLQRADLGFRQAERLIVPLPTGDPLRQETLRERLLQIPGVDGLTRCDAPPLLRQNGPHPFAFGTGAEPQPFSTRLRTVDRAYLPLFGIRLLAGRNFQTDDTTRREVLVNQMMTRQLGLASPAAALGQRLHVAGRDHEVVGVVADFHLGHFREPIHPLTLVNDVRQCRTAVLHLNAAYLPGAVAAVERTWNAAFPREIFNAQFVDEMVTSLYQAERIMLGLAQAFALVAVLIGCLGLYGLVMFMAAAKTKEIGIRKVLGAEVPQLLWLFGREFGKLIGLGFVPAAVLGGLLMNGWLQVYTYRISVGWWVFALALGLVVVITLLTVARESLRAALRNPARSLRTE